MRRAAGQAARFCGRLLHRVLHVALAACVLVAVAFGAIVWRLSQGPWDSPWLARRIEQAASTGTLKLQVGTAGIAWEGLHGGTERPLVIRLTGVTATGATADARIGVAHVALSLAPLLLGEVRVRAVEIDSVDATLRRDSGDATLRRDASSDGDGAPAMSDAMREMGRPAAKRGDDIGTQLSHLRLVRVHDAHLTVDDRTLGTTWQVSGAVIDLHRQGQGGVTGTAAARLSVNGQTTPVALVAALEPGGAATNLRMTGGPVVPAALDPALAALDAPVTLAATARLDAALQPTAFTLDATAGAGHIALADPPILLTEAAVSLQGTPADIALAATATVRASESGLPSTLRLGGDLHRAQTLSADLTLDLDQAQFADVAVLWPDLTHSPARAWLSENITTGTAHNGHFTASLQAPPDLSDVQLTQAGGGMDAENLTVHWLRPTPPIDQGRVKLKIVEPDVMDITILSAHQSAPGATAGLVARGGHMTIRGIVHKDQVAQIEADLAASVPDTLAFLRIPRLKLLDKHPLDLKEPAGKTTVKLSVTLPLEAKVRMEQVSVHAVSRIDDLHLGKVVAGRNLDHGAIDLDATDQGLTAKGTAMLAGFATTLGIDMDFRAGPPSQILQTITATGEADARQLAAGGLDTAGVMTGAASVRVNMTERRDGAGQVRIEADLTNATLAANALDWRKPGGASASGLMVLRLDHGHLAGVDSLRMTGDGIDVQGTADYASGRPSLLRLDRLVLGRTEAHGTIAFPANPNAPSDVIHVNVAGPRIDLSGRFSHHDESAPKPPPTPKEPPVRGTPWALDARFDQALMGQGQTVSGVTLAAENDGLIFRRLRLDGRSAQAPLRVAIEPAGRGRTLTATAGDAGRLLRALDIDDKLEGGSLSVTGTFDDARETHPLSGTATLQDFRVRGAPGLAKLLQAMTLYGLVEAVQGPGLGFIKAIAPFRLEGDTLDLSDARAYSASLGMTAKGRIDIANNVANVSGTIVPAYMLNAALGNIPLVGKLFTSEAGGGLFAATYTIDGPTADPKVSVNPLSVLAPGRLRDLFGG